MIDWHRVEQLKGEIGADDFAEVVVLFLDEVDGVIARLDTRTDTVNLGDDLHFLKGSALNLGFRDFARLCQDGEHTAKTAPVEMSFLRRVIDCYGHSRAAFLTGVNAPTKRSA
ncbi:Hpt domain-containing protein [Oceaniglobus ichthyenteri]|uniref:Hpt domain-containing protein n=1 Tax=Oceaniglobus ichthyenteri TaxID=2136177 RepID=UPI000D3A2B84|nr:Hpt domain-containing protein [Oceaniglobus ichthyenteri]